MYVCHVRVQTYTILIYIAERMIYRGWSTQSINLIGLSLQGVTCQLSVEKQQYDLMLVQGMFQFF